MRHQHAVDHVNDAIGLINVGCRDRRRHPFAVTKPELAILLHDPERFAADRLQLRRAVTLVRPLHQHPGIEPTGHDVICQLVGRLTVSQERAAVRALRTFERRCFVVDVSSVVRSRVGRPFPVEPIRTLDALHLATAELLDERPQLVTIVTRDARVSENARAPGLSVE